MDSIEIINKRLDEELESLKDINLDEVARLEIEYNLIKECINVLNDDDLLMEYDFTKIIELLKNRELSFENLSKMIIEIKQVLEIRKKRDLSAKILPFSSLQRKALTSLNESLEKAMSSISKELEGSKKNEPIIDDKKVKQIESIVNIIKGEGRRKYYTEEEFLALYELMEEAPLEEKKQVLMSLLETKNLKSRGSSEVESLENVIELYKEFLPNEEFSLVKAKKHSGLFLKLIEQYENEILSFISINRTREILLFFKNEGILDKFDRSCLLGVSLYGNPRYVKDFYNNVVKKLSEEEQEIYFLDTMGSVWVQENSKSSRKPFRHRKHKKTRTERETESLYDRFHELGHEDFKKNVETINQYRDFFSESYDIDAFNAHLASKMVDPDILDKIDSLVKMVKTSRYIRKNVILSDVFMLGRAGRLPVSAVKEGELEDKIHLAIELGVLKPPRDEISRKKDEEIPLNDNFAENARKVGNQNQTIRNYFSRNVSRLHTTPRYEFGYLFMLKKELGDIGFFKEFFSQNKAGQRTGEYTQIMKQLDEKYQGFDYTLFEDLYVEYIDNYPIYDNIISERDYERFNEDVDNLNHYYDESILEEPLIKSLETNNRVYDIVMYDGIKEEVPSEFVYKFGSVLISRYKVLRNASILKEEYGFLNEDMIKTCIVRNSYLDEDDLKQIMANFSKGREL